VDIRSEGLAKTKYLVGIDIGGTFTDFTVMNQADGTYFTHKTPTEPADLAAGLAHGFRDLLEGGRFDAEAIECVVNGTTIGLNTILTRSGCRLGLIVTQGFRDLLEIARLRVPNGFDLFSQRPAPLIPRSLVYEVTERISSQGAVLTALDAKSVEDALVALRGQSVEGIVVSLINAYRNPCHERQVRETARQCVPGLEVYVATDLWPEIREYERTMVGVANAYVAKQMASYLDSVKTRLEDIDIQCPMLVTSSNGGVLSLNEARRKPVLTLKSGPAAGVVATALLARACGVPRVFAFDMGGTSSDVAIVEDGQIVYSREGDVDALPLVLPMVDISCIGAGGGSVGWVDSVGVLKVGPQSAGADPGPACYAKGGTSATVTDAYLTVGILDPLNFLGGRIPLRPDRSLAALERLGASAAMSALATAEGLLKVATATLSAQFRTMAAKRGLDIREFALVAYGGAGPTHACMLADELEIDRILVPHDPATFCSLGILTADLRTDFIRSANARLSEVQIASLDQAYDEMEGEARDWERGERALLRTIKTVRTADIRYAGQSYELEIECASPCAREQIAEAFHDEHEARYGHSDRKAPIELVNLRLTVLGETQNSPRAHGNVQLTSGSREPLAYRDLICKGQRTPVPVYKRSSLGHGTSLSGPCLIEQSDTTCYVTAGWRVELGAQGVLNICKGERK
jgi:N-methylhydantoinase A